MSQTTKTADQENPTLQINVYRSGRLWLSLSYGTDYIAAGAQARELRTLQPEWDVRVEFC